MRNFLLILVGLGLAGCGGSAVSSGRNTALDSVDLVSMTDDMAMKIMGSPMVQQQIAERGKLKVVVQPVENLMTAEVLPRGSAEAFTGRLRVLLSQKASDRFAWIMNRDDFYKLRQRETNYDLGPQPGDIQPEYALVARFSSITEEDPRRRESYYLCVFELTNIQDRTLLWSDKYEVKKQVVRTFMD